MPQVYPVTPPMKANQPTLEFLRPMARSMPCTGKGVNTSQRVKPASRTFSAACMMPAGVVNSAMSPYGFAGVPFIFQHLLRRLPQLLHASHHPTDDAGRPGALHL